MSVLLTGMKMPKDENGFVKLVIFNDGRCFVAVGENEVTSKTGTVIARELPPHGRLGDLDALAAKDNADYEDAMASIADVSSRSIVCQIHYGAQKMIAEAETLIPADPEGGDDG